MQRSQMEWYNEQRATGEKDSFLGHITGFRHEQKCDFLIVLNILKTNWVSSKSKPSRFLGYDYGTQHTFRFLSKSSLSTLLTQYGTSRQDMWYNVPSSSCPSLGWALFWYRIVRQDRICDTTYLQVLVHVLIECPQLDDQVLRVDYSIPLFVKLGKQLLDKYKCKYKHKYSILMDN